MQRHNKKSWCWPNSSRDIAEIFILPGRLTANINLQDISTIFNVWNRCLHFNRNVVQMLAPLKENRNELIHDSQNMKLTNARKKLVFQNIKSEINHPDVLPLIPNHADLSHLIRDLEKGKLFEDEVVLSLRATGIQIADIQAKLDEIVLESRNTNRTILHKFSRIHRDLDRNFFCMIALLVLVLALLLAFSQRYVPACTMQSNKDLKQPWNHSVQNKERQEPTSTEGCLPETTGTDDFERISLFEYISHHENFTGRDWLIEIIDTKLQQEEYRGVLLEAGLGFGKSALMKHIICAPEHSLAHRLRRRLLAYHVCRFDVIVSKQAHIFVWRLVDMISLQIPFLAEEINSCKKVFDIRMCERDPNGCLDQCIMIPLKIYLHLSHDPFIIAIDALDECYDEYRDQNEILNLLKQRLYRFPTGVKFLISTRPNQRGIKHLLKDILLLKLDDESKENIKDVKRYTEQFNLNSSAPYFLELANTNINNFQLVTLLLKNRIVTGSTVPVSLERYYFEEFNRVFGNVKNAFVETKQILEVMCTSFQSTTKDNLWYILSNSSNISFKRFEKSLQMLENFIRNINGELHIFHRSLLNWLKSPTNEDFSVDIENGHKMNAVYLFKLIKDDHFPLNVVDLAIHVDYSSEPFLQTRFKDLSERQVKDIADHSDEYPVLELAKRVDSSIATEILVSQFTEVEKRNRNNLTALFIAASFGNLKTFETLIKRGANVTVRTDTYTDIINFENASRVSFEHMFWGYGILDIAAQNGQSNIVEYILINNYRLFDYPVLTLNGMMLLPIHLACKEGHSKIVKQLHAQYNWMLDWQCLYYASENGHIDLVKYILENNVRDQCRLCTTHLHWIPKGHLRVQGQIVYPEKLNYTYILFDDWNNITCESAFHVAVRKNKLDIVKLLLKKRQKTINCVDRGGRTPLLSAVQYGYRDIVEHLVKFKQVLGNETCSTVTHLTDNSRLHKNEIKRLEEYICENKMSLAHIVAKYDRKWVVEILHLYDIKIDWNVTDSNGCFPSHIASCHGSLRILKTILETFNRSFKTFKCQNGSNPLHSAAVCTSVTATEFLLQRYVQYEQESKSVKMSYIKHTLLHEYHALLARDIVKVEENTAAIVSMLLSEESDLLITDELKRNILHFAILNGHFHVVMYLLSHYKKTAEVLLKAEDINNRTPLYHAIHHLEPYSQYFIFSKLWKDVFAEPLDQMSAKDYSLLLIFEFWMNEGSIRIHQQLLKQLVRKGCLNVIVYLTEHAEKFRLERSLILSVVLENGRHGIELYAYLNIVIERDVRMPSEYLNMLMYTSCQELRSKYHLHLLALNYLKVSTFVSLLQVDPSNNVFFKRFFPKRLATVMSTCYDGEDFNVLERAIQGGCSHLVRYLLKVGVTTDLPKVKLVQMALNGLKYRSTNEYFAYITISKAEILQVSFIHKDCIIRDCGSNQVYTDKVSLLTSLIKHTRDFLSESVTFDRKNLDILVSELLKYNKHDITKSDMCSPGIRKFSIIHRLAFEGLLSAVKSAVKYWGKDILLCKNADGFTPLFMSAVFQNKNLGNYILNYGINLEVPVDKAELYFYFKLQFRNFLSREKTRHIECIMTYATNVPSTPYQAIKAFSCAKRVIGVIQRKDILERLKRFKWDLAFIIEKSTFDKITMEILMFRKRRLFIQNKDMYIRYIQMFEVQHRICNYLRISYRKMLLKLQKCVENGRIHFSLKERALYEIKLALADNLYEWDTTDCLSIDGRFLKTAFKHVSQHIQELRIHLLHTAIKEYVFLYPLSKTTLKFNDILNNLSLWFRLHHHYDYMDELQTSTSYRESYFYEIKNQKIISSYLNDVQSTVTFINWNDNTAKILESHLKKKREG